MQSIVNRPRAHPNTAEGANEAMKEIVAVVGKSFADLPPPPSAPAACEGEMNKLRDALKKAPGTAAASEANLALLRCTSKATNQAECKGKPQPCGVAYFNPPITPPDPRQPMSKNADPKAIDVSAPDQIATACREIAGAAGAASSTSTDANAATSALLGSLVGQYSCRAWFKAAAKNDPTLLITPTFVPTLQLIRDLKTYTTGLVDVTPEAEIASSLKNADRAVVRIPVGSTFVPLAVLPNVPAGSTAGQVLDEAHKTVQERVNQLAKAVQDSCKAAGICH